MQISALAEVESTSGGSVDAGAKKGDDSASGGISQGTTDGDVVVQETTLSLDPDNVEQQAIVTDWLGGTGNHEWPGALPMSALDASQSDPDDPFGQLLFEQATSTEMVYDQVDDVTQFGFNIKVGLALGADFTMASEETTITDARMLGAPRSDGTRPVLDYTECVG